MHLAVWIRHKNRVLPKEPSALTIEEILFLLAHPPGPEWSLLLAPTEEAVQAIERDGKTVLTHLVPPSLGEERSRAIGAFRMDAEALRYVLENPGAGRYCLAVDSELVQTLTTSKSNGKDEATPVAIPPAVTEAVTSAAPTVV